MKIPPLSMAELDALDNHASALFGRNPQLGMDFICQVAPASEAAGTCRQIIYAPSARLSFKQLSLVDVTGSLDAGLYLMNWIFDDIIDWTMDAFIAGSKAQTAGSYHFSFDRPNVHASGQGWTPYSALMRALLSGLRWEIRKASPADVASDEWDQCFECSYLSAVREEIPLDADGNPVISTDIEE